MSSVPQYEFDEKQNQVIEGLSRAMQWIAAPLQVVGVLYGIAVVVSFFRVFRNPVSAFEAVYAALGMLFFLALGNWTAKAAQSFHRIVETSGRDITNLMDGLDNLRKMYGLLSTLVKIYVVFTLVVVVAAIIVAVMSAL
jgi:hypothetical protein